MSTSAVGAEGSAGTEPSAAARWAAVLFMIGSACFALPSVPGTASIVSPTALSATYFVGSIFFTSAALVVTFDITRTAMPDLLTSLEWWAAVVQLVGTVWFNLNTFDALQLGMSAHAENLRVWTPDMLGSICFLVSSELSLMAVCDRPWCVCRDDARAAGSGWDQNWTIAALNLLGSVFFMLAALAAFTRPATDDMLDASLANTGTLLGALCFFWAARLSLPHR